MKKDPEGEFDFAGTTWTTQEIDGQATGDIASTMEFRGPGQVGGNAGCNTYTGQVTFNGVAVAFGDLAVTRKMCPAAQMDQEQRFLGALTETRRLELKDEGRVLLLYADGRDPLLKLGRTGSQ